MPVARKTATAAKKTTATAAKKTTSTRTPAKATTARKSTTQTIAAKKAAPAATRKAAPARASKKAAASTVDEEPDLLAQMAADDNDVAATYDDDGDYDLLSNMTEGDGVAWMPWEEDDQPDGIQGTLTYVGTVQADERYGGHDVSYWELQDKDDPELVWGIRGYSTVLGNQMERAESREGFGPGWRAGIVHKGMKDNRKGDNEYRDFRVVVVPPPE